MKSLRSNGARTANKMYVPLWVRFKVLVLLFKQRSASWDNLLILNPQRHIHKRKAYLRQMKKKIRETLDSWDLKSVFLTICFLLIGLFLFFYFTDIRDRFRTEDKEKFKGRTTGQITSVDKTDRIAQSRWNGTKIYVDSYRLTYLFQYEGEVFENIDIIPVTIKNETLLAEILDRGATDGCTVRFDTDDPNKSLLIESE